jgi:hypothetical protein
MDGIDLEAILAAFQKSFCDSYRYLMAAGTEEVKSVSPNINLAPAREPGPSAVKRFSDQSTWRVKLMSRTNLMSASRWVSDQWELGLQAGGDTY